MSALVDPFRSPFMQRAWLELALLAVPAGGIGAFVVLRRLAFPTHALGVGAFPGVVLAAGLGFSPFLGGLGAALVLAAALALLTRRGDLHPSAATGLVLAASLAVGSLLVSDVFPDARVDGLLFGSLLGVDDGDLLRAAAVAVATLLALAAFARPWLLAAFDPAHAPALGARPGRDDAVLLALLAVAVTASVTAVGALLVSSLLVVPAATARLVTHRLPALVVVAATVAVAVSTVGLWTSHRTGAPPGATIAATASVLFALVLAATTLRGRLRRFRPSAAAGVAGLLALLVAGCGGSSSADDGRGGGRPSVVATTPIVADWVRQVAGDRLEVGVLVDAAVDPHDFEPGPREAEAVADARLVVAAGAGLDEWAADLAGDVPVVEIAPEGLRHAGEEAHGGEGEEHAHGEGEGDAHGDVDPHYWHDPRLARQAVEAVGEALAEADPAQADAYRAAAGRYGTEIGALDAELAARVATVPTGRRRLVTDHDAFGYLADRYGLEVVGTVIPSTSTAAEPDARATADLIEVVRAQRVRAIFTESNVDPKLARQVAAETGATVYPDLLGDTLAPPGSPGSDYLGMMRHNVETIVEGLTR